MTAGQKIVTVETGRPEIRRSLDRAQEFLALVAMLAVLIAAVAVALGARRFGQRHRNSVAVMRCLGATQTKVTTILLGEFILTGVLASLVGVALGWGGQALMVQALGGLLGTGSWISPEFGFALPFGALTLGNGRYNINFSVGRGMIWNDNGVSAENLYSVGGMARITSRTSFVFDSFITEDLALLIPTLRIHRKSEGAFQFGFGQLVVEGESIPVPFFSRLWTL